MEGLYFTSKEHEEFYKHMLRQSGRRDKYHCAFFYCIGITEMTRDNIGKLFDFEEDSIKPGGNPRRMADGREHGRLHVLLLICGMGICRRAGKRCCALMNCSTAVSLPTIWKV